MIFPFIVRYLSATKGNIQIEKMPYAGTDFIKKNIHNSYGSIICIRF